MNWYPSFTKKEQLYIQLFSYSSTKKSWKREIHQENVWQTALLVLLHASNHHSSSIMSCFHGGEWQNSCWFSRVKCAHRLEGSHRWYFQATGPGASHIICCTHVSRCGVGSLLLEGSHILHKDSSQAGQGMAPKVSAGFPGSMDHRRYRGFGFFRCFCFNL